MIYTLEGLLNFLKKDCRKAIFLENEIVLKKCVVLQVNDEAVRIRLHVVVLVSRYSFFFIHRLPRTD